MEQGAGALVGHLHRQRTAAGCWLRIPIQIRRWKHRHLHRIHIGTTTESTLGLKDRSKGPRLVKRMFHRQANAEAAIRKGPRRPSRVFSQSSQCCGGILAGKNIDSTEVDGRRSVDFHLLLERIETATVGRHLPDGKGARVGHGQRGHRIVGEPESAKVKDTLGRPYTLIHRRQRQGWTSRILTERKKCRNAVGQNGQADRSIVGATLVGTAQCDGVGRHRTGWIIKWRHGVFAVLKRPHGPIPLGHIGRPQTVVDHRRLKGRASGVLEQGKPHQGLGQHHQSILQDSRAAEVGDLKGHGLLVGRVVLHKHHKWRQRVRPYRILKGPLSGTIRGVRQVRDLHRKRSASLVCIQSEICNGRTHYLHILAVYTFASIGTGHLQ